MSKRFNRDDFLRISVSWAEQIASKDSDYQDYAGASLEDALRLAKIDVTLFMLPEDHVLKPLLKMARLYQIQKKKAYFCSAIMGEISKLGAIKGSKPYDIRAKLKAFK